VAGYGFPSARASLHALSCLAFLFLFLSAFVSAASFRLFIFSAWRRLIRRCSGTGGLEVPHLNPCRTRPKMGSGKGDYTTHDEFETQNLPEKCTPARGAS